jgi:pentatricopeptide repeat protein
MQQEGVFPDVVTFLCILKACGSLEFLATGEEIHAMAANSEKSILLCNKLVDMYAKCGEMGRAQEVFDEMLKRDVVSWNALIAGYARHGLDSEALKCFESVRRDDGIAPDAVTFICILKACGNLGRIEVGEKIHIEARNTGLLEKDVVLGTTLVDMYAKMGMVEEARRVFEEELLIRNVVSWNALMSGYTQLGFSGEALSCFRLMQYEGVSPDPITFHLLLKACGSMGSLAMGESIHAEVDSQCLWEKDMAIGHALVDMYGKCGMPAEAQQVFEGLPSRDVVTWSALMDGYAHMGEAGKVIEIFNRMIGEDVMPDVVTFLVLLIACDHAGQLEEGLMIFYGMDSRYSMSPTLEHYTCMVDLLGRAGHFNTALNLIEKVSSCHQLQLLSTLLGSCCCNDADVGLARWAFKQLLQLDENYVSAYVCMGNIYARINCDGVFRHS